MILHMPSHPGAPRLVFFLRRVAALCAALLLAQAFAGITPVQAATAAADPGALCTLDAQFDTPDLCPSYGPAPERAAYWSEGLLPRQPLPVFPMDPALAVLDRSYAAVSKDRSLDTYATVEDAIAGNVFRTIPPGYVRISFIDVIRRDEGTFLMTGDWKDIVRREDVAPIDVVKTQFTGFRMAQTPARPFGWAVAAVYPSRTAGGKADKTLGLLNLYAPVEVFNSQDVNGTLWYQIGVDEWVDQKKVGLVPPLAELPAGVPAGAKWISVNLFEQTLAAYEGDQLVFATLTATGVWGFWTRPGLFTIQTKRELDTMQGAFNPDKSDFYFVSDVPWVMYFDKARAIHGEYWHNYLGAPRSHGCVNIPVADAHWLFDWASVGTPVWVYDPSGFTPTDDAHYANDAGAP